MSEKPKQFWWNNGSCNTRASECPGDGWTRGPLPRELKPVKVASESKPMKVVHEPVSLPQPVSGFKDKSFKIQYFPEFYYAYDLSGLDLLVFALIHSELELTASEIQLMIRFPDSAINNSIDKLLNEGFICVHNDTEGHYRGKLNNAKNVYFVNKEFG